ncbi:hypothetical protein K449DRAFT_341450, partial [Hypoxylon sp. EC38]
PLLGLNPCEFVWNLDSYTLSSMSWMAFCTTFSLGEAIVRGLVSFFPGLGICTLLAGVNLNSPALNKDCVFSIYFRLIPSRVV